jgi:predicted RNase H-like HicB family nuclease
MASNYTAVIQQRGPWWIGWVEEVAGVNSQAATRDELLQNLQSALQEALEMNRADWLAGDLGTPLPEAFDQVRESHNAMRRQ